MSTLTIFIKFSLNFRKIATSAKYREDINYLTNIKSSMCERIGVKKAWFYDVLMEYIHFSMNLTAIFTSIVQKKRKEKIGINDIA